MANQKHLDILKQGVDTWNTWRKEHPRTQPNLSGISLKNISLKGIDLHDVNLRHSQLFEIDLSDANLKGALLYDANLSGTWFFGSNLSGADLRRADLADAHPNGANLCGANLTETDLFVTDLRGADLRDAQLNGATLDRTDLSGADLRRADLHRANLSGTDLYSADLSHAIIGRTTFNDIDLRHVKGLDAVQHQSPSFISTSTLERSQGKIPEVFLRSVGLSDSFIEHVRSLIGRPIEYYTCFISYANQDEAFARRLHADLQQRGVRCWFAPEDLKIGEKFWYRIDESIRLYDKFMVILSQHSIESEWVEREVLAALEQERQRNKIVLFPLTLDEAEKQCTAPWAADIRRSRHIGDFMHWKDHNAYQQAFIRLLRDLQAEAC